MAEPTVATLQTPKGWHPPFTSETARLAGSKPKPSVKRDYKDALELQQVLKRIATDGDTKPSEVSSAVKAWVDLFNVRRIIALPEAPPGPLPAPTVWAFWDSYSREISCDFLVVLANNATPQVRIVAKCVTTESSVIQRIT